jgi:methionyl-tRNA formyltransferase
MANRALDIVFAGTPEFAAHHLESLIAGPHRVVAVYTQPDRRAGRGKKLLASPVKTLATKHGLPVKQPLSLKDSTAQQELRGLAPDLMVVVAYGLILPEAVLRIPRFGCINVHASLLPRWRGAAPIERALLAGDEETGVTIMQMDVGLDTGAMLLRSAVTIESTDTRVSLESKLAAAGIEALGCVLDNFAEYQASAEAQDDRLSTYAKKLEKEEALIDWLQSASQIDRQIRAGIGRHPAYCLADTTRIRLLAARVLRQDSPATPGAILALDKQGMLVACGQGCLLVQEVQLPGKNPVTVAALLNSRQSLLQKGARLTGGQVPDPGTSDE